MSSRRASSAGDPEGSSDAPDHRGLVLGTAGHIDHGKTSVVRALTGIDCDRLPEEKARGITIDLGFAPLDLGDELGVISVVDVPGHERLVRTMVSGASGIDLVMLVVAADEGVMPQTREHVAICELLGLERGVVALTKCDLVDEEMLELATEDVRDALADTALADAPIVPCSAVGGDGIDELRAALARCVADTPPRTARGGPPRLGIDRVFAIKGFGTVVTGTLIGAPLREGENVEVHPIGLRARVRGLQSHGQAVREAQPGMRTALNLQGLEVAQLSRGEVVSLADALAPTHTADVRLNWLANARPTDDVVAIELLVGTAERRARLAPIGVDHFTPGNSDFARLHIDGDPLPLLPGDRFIARGFARNAQHGGTLGGGVVLDAAPPHRRRSDPSLLRELELLAQREPEIELRERVLRTGLAGAERGPLQRELGFDEQRLEALAAKLEANGTIVRAGRELWIGGEAIGRLEATLLAEAQRFHDVQPLKPGIPTGTLRGALAENVRPAAAELAIERLRARGALVIERDLARLPTHAPKLDSATQQLVERMRGEAEAAGLEPASERDWSDRLGVSIERFRDLAAHLEREAAVVRAPGDLWFDRGAVEQLCEQVRAYLGEHDAIDTAAYKELTGTSRRTTVPLMELLDELGVTRRRGDARVLR
jgi:selenocysteine-specific elongation factor